MKIKIISDLHLEFNKEVKVTTEDIDVLIIAGDTAQGLHGMDYCLDLLDANDKLNIIYVCGNHEYYQSRSVKFSMEELDQDLKKMSRDVDRFHFLQNNSVFIDGVKFIGSTLWASFNNGDLGAISNAWSCMNDYQCISYTSSRRKLTPWRTFQLHKVAKEYIFEEIRNTPNDTPCFIVTHHKPYINKDSKYNDELSHAYKSDLTPEMDLLENKNIVWVYGHSHHKDETTITYKNNTVITFLNNPLGYPNEECNKNYEDLVIEG